MSWKTIDRDFLSSYTGYYWLYDSRCEEVVLAYLGNYVNPLTIDPDYTHWMADMESSEDPDPPDEDNVHGD
jgi:hypothetical protein